MKAKGEHESREHRGVERGRKCERRTAGVEQCVRRHRVREQRLTARLCPRATRRDERTAEADGLCRGEGSIGSRNRSHLSLRDEGGPRYLIERKDAGGRVRSHEDSLRRGKSLAYVERVFAAKTCLRLCSAR